MISVYFVLFLSSEKAYIFMEVVFNYNIMGIYVYMEICISKYVLNLILKILLISKPLNLVYGC